MYLPRMIYVSIDSCVHLSANLFSFLASYLPIHPCTELSTQPSTYPSPSVFHIASARCQLSDRKGTVRKDKYRKGEERHGAKLWRSEKNTPAATLRSYSARKWTGPTVLKWTCFPSPCLEMHINSLRNRFDNKRQFACHEKSDFEHSIHWTVCPFPMTSKKWFEHGV